MTGEFDLVVRACSSAPTRATPSASGGAPGPPSPTSRGSKASSPLTVRSSRALCVARSRGGARGLPWTHKPARVRGPAASFRMNRSPRTSVAILGAGLTGMSASHHLGRAGVDHRIFERLGRPGGHAITIEDEGYRFDRTGHLLHLRDPELRAMALGFIGDDFVEVERRSRDLVARHVHALSRSRRTRSVCRRTSPTSACSASRRRTSQQTRPEPTNFEEFCLTHFGEGISQAFHDPVQHAALGRARRARSRRRGARASCRCPSSRTCSPARSG